ncbi:MAG: permease-like cell division protein FtsX [Syntrophothermus sp.]
MRISTVGRLVLQGARNFRQNGLMTLASVSITSLSLIILGAFFLLIFNLNYVGGVLEGRVEIRVFLKDGLAAEQRSFLEDQIRHIETVKSVDFISREKALERLKNQFGGRGEIFNYISGNPLPDMFEVRNREPGRLTWVAEQVAKLPGVEKVSYGKEFVGRLFAFTRTVWILTSIAALLLSVAIIFIITNTIRLTVFARRREIEIMKLVGATDWFIRWPFLFEGIFLGLAGAIIATLVVDQSYLILLNRAQVSLPFVPLISHDAILTRITVFLMGTGALVGAIGSLISVKRFLHV